MIRVKKNIVLIIKGKDAKLLMKALRVAERSLLEEYGGSFPHAPLTSSADDKQQILNFIHRLGMYV